MEEEFERETSEPSPLDPIAGFIQMQGHFVLHLAFFLSIFVVKKPLEEQLVCLVTERVDLTKYNEEFVEIKTENGRQMMYFELGDILVF
jgi:hypothetical protein